MAKATECLQIQEEMKYLPITNDIFVVMYVANAGVTKQQMCDHYERIMLPWLKYNEVTKAKCWIAQHGDSLSIIVQVDAYVGEWSKIQDIHKLYRSDHEVLMKAELVWEGDV